MIYQTTDGMFVALTNGQYVHITEQGYRCYNLATHEYYDSEEVDPEVSQVLLSDTFVDFEILHEGILDNFIQTL